MAARRRVVHGQRDGLLALRQIAPRKIRGDDERLRVFAIEPLEPRLHAGELASYLKIGVDGRLYVASRLAFLYMTGSWPVADIDHKNLDRTDDRWSNLRTATASQNAGNTRRRSNNLSGFKGVSLDKRSHKWRAQIIINGAYNSLGYFATPEAAASAYAEAAKEHFGEFARLS